MLHLGTNMPVMEFLEEVKFKKIDLSKYATELKSAKKGPNSKITEIRILTAELLKRDLKQVCGLTRGWTHDQLYGLYRDCSVFINPPALWWKLYKKNKDKYGKTKKEINERRLRKLGASSRNGKQEERQAVLF